VTCAVATNDDTGRVGWHLDRLGLSGFFETVVTAREICRKPAPDLYLETGRNRGKGQAATSSG